MSRLKVVKLGGSTFDELDPAFFEEWRGWLAQGNELIVVHGGGPALSAYCEDAKIDPAFHRGIRVTTDEVLKGAERVLAGEMQTRVVRSFIEQNLLAVGLSGVDAGIMRGRQLEKRLGAVGDVEAVDGRLLRTLTSNGYIPVVTSLLFGTTGTLNCNGDACAVALAEALEADVFELITDVPGVRIGDSFRSKMTPAALIDGIENGEINGGMIPKCEAAVQLLARGAEEVVIRSGKDAGDSGTTVKEGNHGTSIANISAS